MLYFRTREEQSKTVAEKSQGKKDGGGGWGEGNPDTTDTRQKRNPKLDFMAISTKCT